MYIYIHVYVHEHMYNMHMPMGIWYLYEYASAYPVRGLLNAFLRLPPRGTIASPCSPRTADPPLRPARKPNWTA